MSYRAIILDTTPLGLLTNPRPNAEAIACLQWLQTHLRGHSRIIIPEIADYELRRELLRAGKRRGLAHLEALIQKTQYLPLSTAAMRQAAYLWARARQRGLPTADDESLDGDVILAAQALVLNDPNMIVATSNVGHLARFVPADTWQNIS